MLYDYARRWGLTVNVDKTKAVIFRAASEFTCLAGPAQAGRAVRRQLRKVRQRRWLRQRRHRGGHHCSWAEAGVAGLAACVRKHEGEAGAPCSGVDVRDGRWQQLARAAAEPSGCSISRLRHKSSGSIRRLHEVSGQPGCARSISRWRGNIGDVPDFSAVNSCSKTHPDVRCSMQACLSLRTYQQAADAMHRLCYRLGNNCERRSDCA